MVSENQFPLNSTQRIKALDGIRGLATISVMIWHYLVVFYVIHRTNLPKGINYLVQGLSQTWAGVDLFFVLSGFLIGGILLDAKGEENYFRKFYIRRLFRIFPLYWLVILSCFWIPTLWEQLRLVASWPTYLIAMQNMDMAANRSFGGYSLCVTWSLCVEEQFYLLLPAILYVTPRKLFTGLLIVCLFFAPILRYWMVAPPSGNWMAAYVLLPCRIDSLALGVLLAIIVRKSVNLKMVLLTARTIFFLAIIGTFALIAHGDTMWTFSMSIVGYSIFALGSASIIAIVVSNPPGILATILRLSPLRAVGTISYGLYLFHLPVLLLCRHFLGVKEGPLTWSGLAYATILPAILSFALAILSWHFFEKQVLKFGHSLLKTETIKVETEIIKVETEIIKVEPYS